MNKDIFQNTYDIIREKFKIHMEKYNKMYELGACKNGDYYTESKRGSFFDMYSWTASFVVGQAPIFYKA